MAELVTLSGNIPHYASRRANVRNRRNYREEMMGGNFLQDLGNVIASPIVSMAKGSGHFVMEAGRGVATGDWKRVATSPFKGVGHSFMDAGRKTWDFGEQFWRPSKMQAWMPMGSKLCMAGGAIATATGVGAPIGAGLYACGIALGLGGAIGTKIHANNKLKNDALSPEQKEEIRKTEKRKQLMIWGVAGLAGAGLLYTVLA